MLQLMKAHSQINWV